MANHYQPTEEVEGRSRDAISKKKKKDAPEATKKEEQP